MAKKRVAVIGAGVSGLTSIKCCLEEGLEPLCFERSHDIGGLWRFQEEPEEGRASIYKSVIINTSKEMMCFSDYPIPDHYPNFMHNSQVLEYFRMYAKEFDLLKYIQFKVLLSTRRGAWILNRVADYGYPFDVVLSSRCNSLLKKIVGQSAASRYLEKKINQRFNHEMFGLKPKHRVLSQHPTINDDLPNRIISGFVKVKTNVKAFTETAAIFEDGSREDDIDAVIFATGYSFVFPFLEDSVKVVKNKVSLYKKVFPPNLEKPTLAIIGLIQPLGAIMPVSELQGRWATQVFKGLKTLPPQGEMMTEIAKVQEAMAKQFVESQRHTIQGDYIGTMDELADQVGVKPNLLSLAFTDPKLAFQLFWGPCTPIQYRLQGPGKWDRAREMILTTEDRIRKPLMTRIVETDNSKTSTITMAKFMLAVVFFAVVITYL
ncbi:flavin-containing monooxygenase 5 isoform X2 [Odocoileus virginianus]|uniref:Flavin-containing monooxygenase n=1 Tax=Odocoileus virginianus TaxID=9874 RepID=A0ABM4I658_ODOVR